MLQSVTYRVYFKFGEFRALKSLEVECLQIRKDCFNLKVLNRKVNCFTNGNTNGNINGNIEVNFEAKMHAIFIKSFFY